MHVEKLNYETREFHARIACDEVRCAIEVYPQELDGGDLPAFPRCPLKYCATLLYSIDDDEIANVWGWQQTQNCKRTPVRTRRPIVSKNTGFVG